MANKDYSIVLNAQVDAQSIKDSLNKLQKQLPDLKLNFNTGDINNATKAVNDNIDAVDSAMLTYQQANLLLQDTIKIVKSMSDEVFALNDAQIEFQKVSDLSGKSLDDYIGTLSELGGTVARTGSEMLEASTNFRKNGFNDEDSAQLAKVAAQFQNIADEQISAGDAASFLISQLIAFKQNTGDVAANAEHITDAVNEVANSFSVSTADISKGLSVVASTSASMGNSMEQTIGMLTAITEQTRSASRSARAMNQIFARLSQTTDESSSTGQKLVKIYNDLGISLYDSQGQLRSSYDILHDLSKQWDSLDKNTQNYIALTSSGSNQLNNFLSLMRGFDHAVAATDTAINSAGSSAKENERFLGGLSSKVQALKTSFQELSNTVLDSELVATFLDLAKGALDLANNLPPAVIQFGLLSTGLTGVLTIMQQFAKNSNLLSLILGKFSGETAAATGAIGLFKGGLAGAIPTALALSAAIVAIYVAYQKYKDYTDQSSRSVEDWQADIDDANAKLEENKKKLDELNNTPWYNMSDDVYEEIDSLEAENKALQEQIDKYEELKKKKEDSDAKSNSELAYGKTRYDYSDYSFGEDFKHGNVDDRSGTYSGTGLKQKQFKISGISEQQAANMGLYLPDLNAAVKQAATLTDAYTILEQQTGKTKEELESLGIGFSVTSDFALENAKSYQNNLIPQLADYTNQLGENGKISAEDNEVAQSRIQVAGQIVKALEEEQKSGKTLTDEQKNLISAYYACINAQQRAIDETYGLTESQQAFAKSCGKTNSELATLLTQYPELASVVNDLGGAYGGTAESVGAAVSSMMGNNGRLLESTRATVIQMINLLKAAAQAQASMLSTGYDIGSGTYSNKSSYTYLYTQAKKQYQAGNKDAKATMDKYEQLMVEQGKMYNQTKGALDELTKLYNTANTYGWDTSGGGSSTGGSTVSSGGGGGGGGSSKVQTALEKQTAEYKNQISALEKQLSLLQEKDASEEEQIEVMKKIQDKLHEQAQYYHSQGIKENGEMIVDLQISWQQYSKKIVELQQQAAEKIKEIWRKNLQSQIDSLSTRKDELESLFKGIASAADDEIDKLEKQKQAVEDKYDAQINALKETNDALNNQLELETAIDNLERAKAQKVLVYKDGKYQYIDDSDAVSEASSNLESVKRQQAQEAEQKRLEQLKDKEVADIEAQIKAWQDYRDSWTALYSDYSDTQNKLLAEQMLGTKLEGKNWKGRIGQLQGFRDEYNSLVSQIGNLQSQLDKGMDSDTTDWSQVWRDAENNKSLTQAERESIQNYAHAQKVQQMQGSGYTYDSASGTWNKHAKGTLNAPGGLTLVGEKGPELGILPKGSGVIPADITKNLWDWGKTNPLDFFKGKLMQESMQNQNISIQNLSLPEVTNGEEFVEYMRKNFWRRTIQFSTNN